MVCRTTSRSPSPALSNAARTWTVWSAVLPAASTRVTEVFQVTPSSDSCTNRAREVEVGSIAGATSVTSTSVVGTSVGRTRIVPVADPVASSSTSDPPTVSTTSAASSLSRISAAMPSTGIPAHRLLVVALSTELRISPVCPRRSSAWTAGACPATSMRSLPRPPKTLVMTRSLVETMEKVSSPSMP